MAVSDGDLYLVGELGLIRRLDRRQDRFVSVKSPYSGSFFGVAGKAGAIFIYGLRGNLFSSRDKGQSWRALNQDMGAALVGGAFLDDGSLVLVSNAGHVLVSNDKGETFFRAQVTEEMLSAVAPVDRNSAILAGVRGVRLQPLE